MDDTALLLPDDERLGAFEKAVRKRYERITRGLIAGNLSITAMESCTSGQIISLLTDTEGASAIIRGAFVTYSNEAKIQAGVPKHVIEKHGVYSLETAAAMAEACRMSYGAKLGLGITGSFGNPDPKNRDSIPGRVYLAAASEKGTETREISVPKLPSRFAYKMYTADKMAELLEKCIAGNP